MSSLLAGSGRSTGRRVAAAVAVVTIAALIAITGAARRESPESPAPTVSTPLTTSARDFDGGPTPETITIDATPERYEIVYRFDDFAGGGRTTKTERVLVVRPYDSHRTQWLGTDTSTEPTQRSISTFGLISIDSGDSRAVTIVTAPTPATGDLRLAAVLDALVDQGRLTIRGESTVAGTHCQVLRTGEPIGTGRLTTPTPEEFTDVCIDDRGLLLEETWHVGGEVLQHRTALEVRVDPLVPDDAFAPFSDPLPAEVGGGELRRVDPGSRPDFTFWELDAPPDGFTHRGRYELLRPSNRPDTVDPTKPGPPLRSVIDVYERGIDLIVIERGSTSGREQELEPRAHGTIHDAGELGEVEVELAVYGTWLRVKTDAVQFLSIRATIPADELLDVARALRPGPRGQLRYVDASDSHPSPTAPTETTTP